METTIQFSPAISIPLPFNVQKRIQELDSYLDPLHPKYLPEQYTNIKAAIKLYEEGKIDGEEKVFIRDGKIVSKEEAFKGYSGKESFKRPPFICEGGSPGDEYNVDNRWNNNIIPVCQIA